MTTTTIEFGPGRTTWRVGGTWRDTGVDEAVEISGSDIRGADTAGGYPLHFIRGRWYPVDAATAAELTKAGYGRQLRRIEAPVERIPRAELPVWPTAGQNAEVEALRARVAELEADKASA